MASICATTGRGRGGVQDGATVMVGGFGVAGQPVELIDALIDSGATDLTIVNNNAGNGDVGLAALHPRRAGPEDHLLLPEAERLVAFDEKYRAGEVELELVAQGNLAERIRAAGAGIGGFYTPTGYGTLLAEGKETREIDGRHYVLEYPLNADVALDEGSRGRRGGQPRLPQDGTKLRPDHGCCGGCHGRTGVGRRPDRRSRPRGRRHPRPVRRPARPHPGRP